jgi:hypothetical protein
MMEECMEQEAFWFVWNEQGRAPTHRHSNEHAAEREAERLARANLGQTFIVLRSVSSFKATDMIRTVFRPDPPF